MFILFSSSFEMLRHFNLLQLDGMVTGQPNQASLHIHNPCLNKYCDAQITDEMHSNWFWS